MTWFDRGPRRTWDWSDRLDHLLAVIERAATRQPERLDHWSHRYAQAWEYINERNAA